MDKTPRTKSDESDAGADLSVLVIVLGISGGRDLVSTTTSLRRQTHPKMQVAYVADAAAIDSDAAQAFGEARIEVASMDATGAAANMLLDKAGAFDVVIYVRDDVILDPDAISGACRAMVKTGAGVIGAKIISAENPDVLVEVGLSSDRFAMPYSRLEGIEIDQSQYDQGKQTLFVSFSFLAVRGELVSQLGGFDEDIRGPGAELDLCWRARMAGEEVVYVPKVRVRQVGAAELLQHAIPIDPRTRLRIIFKNYGPARLLLVGFQAFLVALAQMSAALLAGRYEDAREQLLPWGWNLRRTRSLLHVRRQAQRGRRLRDGRVTRLMVRGTTRFLSATDVRGTPTQRWNQRATALFESLGGRWMLAALLMVLFVLLTGRNLIFGDLPILGRLAPPSGSAFGVIGDFLAPWRNVDVGTASSAPAGLAATGLVGVVTLGSAALLQKLFLLLGLPLAAVVCSRALRPTISSPGVRAAAAAVYAFGPLWWNALAEGDLGALAVAVLLPTIVRRLAHLTGLGAYREDVPPLRRKLELILLIAVGAAVEPAIVISIVLVMIGWGFASILVGGGRACLDTLWHLAQAFAGAFLLLLPWTFSLLRADAAASAIGADVTSHTFLELLRFETDGFGGSVLMYGLVIGALLPLLVARGPRFAWATRWWGVAVVSFFGTWLVSRGVLPPLGRSEVLLAPAALAMAVLVGWGLDAIRHDLSEARFGLRQPASLVLLAATAVGLLAPLSALAQGRFGQPDTDWRTALAWQAEEAETGGTFRNLFVGHNVPGGSRVLDGDLRFAVTSPGGPKLSDLWLPASSDGTDALAEVTRVALSDATLNAGRLLAPFGIRYVVIPAGNRAIVDSISGILDFKEIQDDVSGIVFENAAWQPTVTGLRTPVPEDETGLAELAAVPLPERFGNWEPVGRAEWEGATGATVYAGLVFDSRFRVLTEGDSYDPDRAYGWALQYLETSPGDGVLIFKAGPWRPALVGIEVALWILVVSGLVGLRGAVKRRTSR